MTDKTLSMDELDDRLETFDLILVPHPRIGLVKTRIESLMRQTKRVIARNDGRSEKAGGRAIKLEELWVLPIIGPTGATKSKSLSIFVDEIVQNPSLAAGKSPIVTITVKSSSKTPKALQVQILEAFGDKEGAAIVSRSNDHSEGTVNRAILELARAQGTLVVALDEAHNMLLRDTAANANTMAVALKSLVNDALFSLVLLGTEEALRLFAANAELTGRKKETVDLGKFEIASSEDRDQFFGFAGYLEQEMLEKGVIDSRLGMIDHVPERAAVYDMAEGVVGIVPRVMRLALERAFEEGRGCVTWDDVANGFRGWKRLQAKLLGNSNDFFDPFDPQNGEGGAKWSTVKQVNKDFPRDRQVKRRSAKAEEEVEEEETV
jgi:hypothetical protein